MKSPSDVLKLIYKRVVKRTNVAFISDKEIASRIEYVCRCLSNRAGVRLLMACLLGKIDRPEVDPRQPYTEIESNTCFSGRTYDERYITEFINEHKLPCNPTTAFLTPALRNIDYPLTKDVVIVGRPPQVYSDTLLILDDVADARIAAEDVLSETIRFLLVIRDEKNARMETLLSELDHSKGGLPLSSEAIINLVKQHLACKNSSRLPVLLVAAAYRAAATQFGEVARPLQSHNAADEQTGSLGDIELCLENDDKIVTSYEMKSKRVSKEDVDRAVNKIISHKPQIHNYIFITTDFIEVDVVEYAIAKYEKLGGIEIAILDCIGFLRHFLHLFHRLRIDFLNEYQNLVLDEPDSAVRQPLKEALLTLRQAAESDE